MIFLLDNYDSFTYNLEQMIGVIEPDVRVARNDQITVAQIQQLAPTAIVLSPGPGRPEDAGITCEVIQHFAGKLPILGVCLGHQAICQVFGGSIVHGQTPIHGKATNIHIANGSPIFKGLPPLIEAARYHSLVVNRDSLPDDLLVIAEDNDGTVMAVKHRKYDLFGVQFHPESILTPQGHIILQNFVKMEGQHRDSASD